LADEESLGPLAKAINLSIQKMSEKELKKKWTVLLDNALMKDPILRK